MLAETSESISILQGLDRRKGRTILAQEDRLHEALTFLVKVPLLQVVYRREVVDNAPIGEAMLQGHQLSDVNHLGESAHLGVSPPDETFSLCPYLVNRLLVLVVAKNFDPKQERVVHEALAREEVGVTLHDSQQLDPV